MIFESISISSQFPHVLCYNMLCNFVFLKKYQITIGICGGEEHEEKYLLLSFMIVIASLLSTFCDKKLESTDLSDISS